MHADARRLVALARTLGFTFEGFDGGSHIRLRHENGECISVSATPSDWRARKNELARLERIAGRKLPRQKRGRSHKRNQVSGFSLDTARSENSDWHSGHDEALTFLLAQRDELIEQARDCARDRGELRAIPPLLRRIEHIESRLRGLHHVFDPFDPFTLSETEQS